MITYEQELARSGRIVFTIRGVSMCPLFKRKSANGKQYVLHRIVDRLHDGRFVIAGDNCSGADIVRPQDILGVVVSDQRGNKPKQLGGLRYEKLWCKSYKIRLKVLRCRDKARSAAKKIISLWRR